MTNENNNTVEYEHGFYEGLIISMKRKEDINDFTKSIDTKIVFRVLPTHQIEGGEPVKLENPTPIEIVLDSGRYNKGTISFKEVVLNQVKSITNGEFTSVAEFAKNCKRRVVGIQYGPNWNETKDEWGFTVKRVEEDDFSDF